MGEDLQAKIFWLNLQTHLFFFFSPELDEELASLA